jgi:hypothetical protein
MRCSQCHRPMLHATPDGIGPVCRKKAGSACDERDLFGFDIDRAIAAARDRVKAFIDSRTRAAKWAARDGFRAARERLLG